MFAPKSHAIVLIAPLMMIASMLDSFLKELPWVPMSAKHLAFFFLVPIIIVCTIAIIPFLRERLSIVTPTSVSNNLFSAAVAVTGLQIALWAAIYYKFEIEDTVSISSIALALKDMVLVSSAAVFGLLETRLLGWYRRLPKRVVLLYAMSIIIVVAFALLQVFPDFLPTPTPRVITDGFAISLLTLFTLGYSTLIIMEREYRGTRGWIRRPVTWFNIPTYLLAATFLVSRTSWLDVKWDIATLTILVFGFVFANAGYPLIFWDLSRVVPNKTASEIYSSMGYSFGIWAFATCGVGLRLSISYPLSGFASLSAMVPAACLSFATFTSSAAYFSISEDLRKQIRRAAGFAASMGEAQSAIVTEQQVGQFYAKFTQMARTSGAVDESAITKDEIYKYVAAVKRLQRNDLPIH